MLELLSAYSVTEILVFLVFIAAAIKGVASFFEWAGARVHTTGEIKRRERERRLQERLSSGDRTMNQLKQEQSLILQTLQEIKESISLLTESDKDDIKACITEKHHFFKRQGWIDDYSLDCLERRFAHYQQEGGNSFVHTLMDEIRLLPKQSPQE